ncbi:hypothetical protein B566_EDAN011127, partial [Ephemera danica]
MNIQKMHILLFLFVIVLQVITLKSFDMEPRDIVDIGGRRYYFSRVMVTPPEATDLCSEFEMTLAGLETMEESDNVTDYITNTLGTTDNKYWTSGVRVYRRYMWGNSGLMFSYDNWAVDPDLSVNDTVQGHVYLHMGQLWETYIKMDAYF